MSGHLTVYGPAFRSLLTALNQDGSSIRSIHATRTQIGSWRDEGALYSLGVHDVAMMEVLLGSGLEEVKWDTVTTVAPFSEESCDCSVNTVGVVEGLTITGEWSFLSPGNRRDFVVTTQKAVYQLNEKNPWGVSFYPFQSEWPPELFKSPGKIVSEMKEHKVFSDGEAQPLKVELEHFLTRIRNGGEFRTGLHHTLAVMKAIDKIEKGVKG